MPTQITTEKKRLVTQIASLEDIHLFGDVFPEVILDIMNTRSEPEPADEHEFGNPPAYTTGLISGNFPYP